MDQLKALLVRHRVFLLIGLATIVLGLIGGAIIGLAPPVTLILVLIVIGGSFFTLRGPGRQQTPRVLAQFALLTLVTLVIIQVVPYGRQHSNPSTRNEPAWATPETRDLMVRACFDCHSNEVTWPWYSSVAPLSWAVTRHVDEGRDEVNYSDFGIDNKDDDDTIEVIVDNEMPPGYYTAFGLHAAGTLTADEKTALLAGLRNTPGFVEEND